MLAKSKSSISYVFKKKTRILIVEGRFYEEINDHLLEGARAALKEARCEVDIITVPGALEIPLAAAIALDSAHADKKPYAGLIALGCVIRGETGHYDIVAGESARALMDLALARRLPFGNGILTVENEEQALKRAKPDGDNKGAGAANAALALIDLSIRRNVK